MNQQERDEADRRVRSLLLGDPNNPRISKAKELRTKHQLDQDKTAGGEW